MAQFNARKNLSKWNHIWQQKQMHKLNFSAYFPCSVLNETIKTSKVNESQKDIK